MEFIELTPAFTDERGSITDLISNQEISSVTLITFKPGAVRANHYHKFTVQWNYVLEGDLLFATRLPDGVTEERVLHPGDFVVTREGESHALKGLTEAKVLIFTKGPRAGTEYENDTYRLCEPLISN